jgi:hypothetical protein
VCVCVCFHTRSFTVSITNKLSCEQRFPALDVLRVCALNEALVRAQSSESVDALRRVLADVDDSAPG